MIATSSHDRQVKIHEESVVSGAKAKKWSTVCTLSDSRGSVTDLQFAPRHHGLKIAACSEDGYVRIYEAVDVTNLQSWPLQQEFEADEKDLSCIAWNPSPFDSPMTVVGSHSGAKVWEYDDSLRKWSVNVELEGIHGTVRDVSWAPNLGRSYHLIAVASDHMVRIFKLKPNEDRTRFVVSTIAEFDQHNSEVWRVSWNMTGTVLASTGDDGTVR